MKTLRFQSTIVESEKINLFTKVKIHVAYEGLNRNSSFISKETFSKAAESARFCPIVGEWSENDEDFKGHGGKIEITDNGIEYKNTTVTYGCISNEEPTWELVEQEDGTSKEYFTLVGYIWTNRFPELESIVKDGQKFHSMEIEIINSNYTKMDGKNVCVINDMLFSGFCILGNDYEPCFEASTISTYSLDKEKFKLEFKQMMEELKFSLQDIDTTVLNNDQKGGISMDELQKLLEKYSLTLNDLSSKEIKHEDFSIEELENKIKEVFKKPQNNEFTLTSEQLEDELKRELCEIETITEEWWDEIYTYPRYSFVDYMPEQSIVVSYDSKDYIIVGFSYSLTNENVEVDSESIVRYKVEYVPMNLAGDTEGDDMFSKKFTSLSQTEHKLKVKESELNKKFEAEKVASKENLDKLTADFSTLQEVHSALETTVKELESFKLTITKKEREDAENELFTSVASELTEDEMKPFKEKAFEMEIADLKKELFALIGQKKFENKPKQITSKFTMSITGDEVVETEISASYDSIITKYIK